MAKWCEIMGNKMNSWYRPEYFYLYTKERIALDQLSKHYTIGEFLQTTIFWKAYPNGYSNQVVCKNPDAEINGEGADVSQDCLCHQ